MHILYILACEVGDRSKCSLLSPTHQRWDIKNMHRIFENIINGKCDRDSTLDIILTKLYCQKLPRIFGTFTLLAHIVVSLL